MLLMRAVNKREYMQALYLGIRKLTIQTLFVIYWVSMEIPLEIMCWASYICTYILRMMGYRHIYIKK